MATVSANRARAGVLAAILAVRSEYTGMSRGAAVVNRRAVWLGALIAGGFLAILLGIMLVPYLLYPPLSTADLRGVSSAQARIELQQAQAQLADNARSSILQGLAGLLVVAGAVGTWRQVGISREGQITERFTRAIDQLGSEKVDVRIGGIYALERIARNSAADRNAIQFVLGAFVRNNASWPVGARDGPQHPTPAVDEFLPSLQVRAPDIQAAMGCLARRPPSRDERMVYLSRVDLRGLSLDGAQLAGTRIRHANLARAQLRGGRLDGCDMKDIDLRQALLEDVHLAGANLRQAHLGGAILRRVNLSHADLRGADLSEAILEGTVLTGAQSDRATVWPAGLDGTRRRELGVIEAGGAGLDPATAVIT